MRTPHELLSENVPNNDRLPISGCPQYSDIDKAGQCTKFSDRAELIVHLGMQSGLFRIY